MVRRTLEAASAHGGSRCRMMAGVLVAAILLLVAVSAWAQTTWHVNPGESIQAAINGAAAGDTIELVAGTYVENLIVNKRLHIIGAGDGESGTIIQGNPSLTTAKVVVINVGGTSPTEQLVIEGIRITGGKAVAPGGNDGAGIELGTGVGYVLLSGVTSTGNDGHGFDFNATTAVSDVHLERCTLTANKGAGVKIPQSLPVLIDFSLTDSVISDNLGIGVLVYSEGATDVTIADCIFQRNNSNGATGGDLVLSGFTGDAVLENLSFDSQDADSVIRMSGPANSDKTPKGPAGTVLFRNIMITGTQAGTYPGAAIAISRYTDGTQISFEDVVLASSGAFGMHLGTIGGTINLGGVTFNGTYATGDLYLGKHGQQDGSPNSYPAATVVVDASAAIFAGLLDPFAIEDLIHHALDDSTLGLVVWNPNNVYVTPASGSIQRGIDVVGSSWTVNVAPGTYIEPLTFAAARGLTLRGDTAALPRIDGGVTFVNTTAINGIAFENLYFTGAAARNKMFNMDGASASVGDFSLENCVFDGEGVADRIGIYGNRFAGTLNISNCEFKDIHGWAVFDLDGSNAGPPYGGTEFVLTSVTFANNYLQNCDGTVSIRGNHATPTATVNVFGNVVESIGGNDGGIGDQWAGIEVNHAAVANIYGNTINDVEMGMWEGQAFQLWDIADLRLGLNVITNNAQGIWIFGGSPGGAYGHWEVPGGIVSLNSITGNAEYGIGVDPGAMGGPLDASANWWGSVDGPTAVDDFGIITYDGGGDVALGNIIYSPWLGADPDGDPLLAGVQLLQPLYIIVDDIGPIPGAKTVAGYVANSVAGYLNRAIGTANSIPGLDTIEVRHGTYDASEPITDGVTIYSEVGSTENTFLNGDLLIDAVNVLIGQMGQGFTINSPLTVGAGIDASTIHINWNDIFSVVTNNGEKMLDATFNYWGIGSDTVGRVRIYPLLPVPAAEVIGYMDDYGFNVMQAIAFARLLTEGRPAGWAETAIELGVRFGIDIDDAIALIREYGLGRVTQALRTASDPEDFLVKLLGYVSGGGGGGTYLGGGGGGAEGAAGFCVGCPIPLQLELVHPITGEPITDAVVSYSLCRTLPDGTTEIVMLGVMKFDGDLGAYVFEVDTNGLEPGIYDVYLGTDDGRSRHFQIEVTES